MKRLFIVIFLPILLILSSCSTSDYLDVFMFCEKFTNSLPQYELDINKAFIQNSKDEILFNIFAGKNENVLIKLYSKKDEPRIRKCSLSMLSQNSKLDFSQFSLIAKTLISVFTQDSDNGDEVIKGLKLDNKINIEPKYFETTFFRYSYQRNEIGINLIIENKLLSPAPDDELTLRNDKKVSP